MIFSLLNQTSAILSLAELTSTCVMSHWLHLTIFVFYFTAYGNNTKTNSSSENFYCDVCDKKLNGPIPYKMHLNSKAHKEEVALKEELNL